MVGRGELTAKAWDWIEPLLPKNGRRGKQWQDHRRVINGILWKLRTGAPWRDLPERYGPWQTCYDRFARWRRDGTWDRLLAHAQTESDAIGEVVWEVSVDTARSPGRISMPLGRVEPRTGKTQKGGLPPRRRGARARPGRVEHEATPLVRRARAPAIARGNTGPAPREHAA